MSVNYRNEVIRTSSVAAGLDAQLNLGAMGLAGECGEVVDLIKKYLFHGKPLDRTALLKELGDVRWYFEVLCEAADTTIEEVEALNIEKLRKRYPNGFNNADAAAKRDEV